MPQHRKVSTLQTLCLRSVGSSAERMAYKIATEVQPEEETLQMLDWFKNLLTHVPYYLYEDVAMEYLEGVRRVLMNSTLEVMEMNIWSSIIEISVNPQLKSLDIAKWTNAVGCSLCTKLHKLTGLEKLNIFAVFQTLRNAEYKDYLCESISAMKKHKSFTALYTGSDALVQVVGNHCREIEYLDLEASNAVTDQSIPYLLKCNNLKTLKIDGTAITIDGLAQLFIGLPNLLQVDYFDFAAVMKRLNNSGYGPFGLRKTESCDDLVAEDLKLFVQMFPKIEHIVFHDRPISDLSILASLDNLKTLLVRFCSFRTRNLEQLKVMGANITSLILECVTDIDIIHIVAIDRYCPNLTSLELQSCEFTVSDMPSGRLIEPLFKNLREVSWKGDGGSSLLEFVLCHAFNIQVINVSISTNISHGFVEKVFFTNPMRNLEVFSVSSGSDLNMRTVEILLEGCANLRVLSRLESWRGIRTEDLKTFKEYISSHNIDMEYDYIERPRSFGIE